MTEKNQNILTLIIVITLLIGGLIFKIIPEYQESMGSSDNLFLNKKYDDMIEFKINHKTNFALITNENKVIHILIFDETAMCIYNQNLENKPIAQSIEQLTNILIESNNITNNSVVVLTKYDNSSYPKIKNNFINQLQKNNINIELREKESTYLDKAKDLNIEVSQQDNIMTQLDLYSKEVIDRYKNKNKRPNKPTESTLTEEKAVEYANNVYQKLENYVITNNIGVQDRNSTALPINLIPASSDGFYYPSTNSWYYVENYKVYAYIEIENYGYCYQGSIEYKKGEC